MRAVLYTLLGWLLLASVAGLARVLTIEHPELGCRVLDGDDALPPAEIAAGDEAEIVWRAPV